MSASDKNASKIPSYLALFHAVQRKRLRYVNRVIVLASLVVSVAWKLPFPESRWEFLYLIYQVPIVCVSLIFVKFCRERNSVVEYLRAKTLVEHIGLSLVSWLFVFTGLYHVASAVLFFGAYLSQIPLFGQYYVLSKEFRKKPAVNDQWIYFWFYSIVCAISYSAQQLVFQRNRLRFKYGVSSSKPQTVIFSTVPAILGTSLVFTLVNTITSPFIYFWVRPTIYALASVPLTIVSVDPAMPPFRMGFHNVLSISFVSFILFVSWEFTNHVYETYAKIGCLDGDHLISSKSLSPVESLLLGLRDVSIENQLVRLSAFQELAFVASHDTPECLSIRKAIYSSTRASSTSSFSSMWEAILDECSLVINEVSLRVNYRTKSDLDALKNLELDVTQELAKSPNNESLIFGNSSAIYSPMDKSFVQKQPIKDELVKEKDDLKQTNSSPLANLAFLLPVKKFVLDFIYSNSNHSSKSIPIDHIRRWVHAKKEKILQSDIGLFFRVSLKRDAESRVLAPVNCGNSIIALSGLLLHAVEEDRYNTVTDQNISDVFNLLERPIRTCINYTNFVPASVFLTEVQKTSAEARSHQLVALLHDMAMREYINICVKYNYKLNDLLLSPRAFKLAKWVIDASIAQQLQRKHQQISQIFQ